MTHITVVWNRNFCDSLQIPWIFSIKSWKNLGKLQFTTLRWNFLTTLSKWKYTAICLRLFRWFLQRRPSSVIKISKFPQDISIKKTVFVSKFFQKLACSPEVCKDDMKHTLELAMKRNGLETEIRNIVFHLIRTSIKNEVKLSMQTVSCFGVVEKWYGVGENH